MVGQLGALARLMEDDDVLRDVRAWYGCSGGAVSAWFGALGVSAAWLRDLAAVFDTRLLSGISDAVLENFLESWGLTDGTAMVANAVRLAETWEPGCGSWTFADLAREKGGVRLVIIATNVSEFRQSVFSVETTPNVRIADAIRASTAIPMFVAPWKDASGSLHCDGAVLEYFPWTCVEEKDATLVIVCEEGGIPGRAWEPRPLGSMAEYLGRLAAILQHREGRATPRNWIAVDTTFVTPIDFHMPRDVRLALFEEGYGAADRWLAFRASRAAAPASSESRRPSEDQNTLSSDHPSPESSLDTPGYRSPLPPPSPSPDSRCGLPRSGRRWSL